MNLSTNPAIPVAWSVLGGGEVSSANGVNTRFTAGDRATTSSVKAIINSNELSIGFSVIEPSGVVMERDSAAGVRHVLGNPSVGMKAIVYITPSNVSFYNVNFREGACEAEADGYFELFPICPHEAGTFQPGSGMVVPDKGYALGIDTIEFGIEDARSPKPYSAGAFTWPIPWYFDVKGKNNEKLFKIVNQTFTINEAGKMSASKAGASYSLEIDAPTSNYNY